MSVARAVPALCLGITALGVGADPAAAQTAVPCDSSALAPAIAAANASNGTLDLAPGCTYALASPLPSITGNVTINGQDSTITRASASAFRILQVDPNGRLTLRNATISNGDATGSFGGGIANFGYLSVSRSVITGNRADFSGGIGGLAGTTTVIDRSAVTNNQVTRNGGGIANDGTMTITRSRILENSAGQLGGGIANDGDLTVSDSNVNENTAASGGGIANVGGGTTRLDGTNVNDNTAGSAPGGVLNTSGTVTLDDSRVRGNDPTNCAGSPVAVPGCRG